jgi:hypothetical protein
MKSEFIKFYCQLATASPYLQSHVPAHPISSYYVIYAHGLMFWPTKPSNVAIDCLFSALSVPSLPKKGMDGLSPLTPDARRSQGRYLVIRMYKKRTATILLISRGKQ